MALFFRLLMLWSTVFHVLNLEMVSLDVNEPKVVQAAEFALKELARLSDSKIYDSLSIAKIQKAYSTEGFWHDNIVISLDLASPYYKSGLDSEEFSVVVMTHKDDGARSFAIDEFPVMDADAIERYTNIRIDASRANREEAFRRLELESLMDDENDQKLAVLRNKYNEGLQNKEKNVEQLLEAMDNEELLAGRVADSRKMQKRIHRSMKKEEQTLSQLSLKELYQISTKHREGTDYQIERSQKILDDFFNSLRKGGDDKESREEEF
jgi:hypothetical protein